MDDDRGCVDRVGYIRHRADRREQTGTLLTTASNSGPFDFDDAVSPFSGTRAVSASALETFLELSSGTLGTLDAEGGDAIEGSAIKQSFTASAGDELSFDFNFLTNESVDSSDSNDLALVTINGVAVLADTFSSLSGSSAALDPDLPDATVETGFSSFSFTAPSDGTFTLGIGVMDVSSDPTNPFALPSGIPSGVVIDNVRLEGDVPTVGPVADAGGPYFLPVPGPLTLDGTGSTPPPGGSITRFDWDLGPLGAASGLTPTVSFPSPGLFDIALTVQDNAGLTDTDTSAVAVAPEPGSLAIWITGALGLIGCCYRRRR